MRRASFAVIVVVAAGCGSSAPRGEPVVVPTTAPAVAPAAVARPAATTATSGRTATTTTTPSTTTTTTTTTTAVAAPPTSAIAAPRAQMIVVSSFAYGRSDATLSAYEEVGSGWIRRFGPWDARIGRNGFAPLGAKHEGDGRTPSGTYGFSFFFGIDENPGVQFEYRTITSRSIVWDDDPASAGYNEWIDSRLADAGARPEPMYNAPFYDYGAVIAYNTGRTPGAGSAIFLHVSNGGSTAGCVALPVGQLLELLRWLHPGRHPRIRMGVDVAGPS